jgi:SagB-type dehydrogenase family enzyme
MAIKRDLEAVLTYHERTKHHPRRFARSLGYMDWQTQPDPFRRYDGAPLIALQQVPVEKSPTFDEITGPRRGSPAPAGRRFLSQLFFDSLALSAWKELGGNRWSLRCNPSSGNLHPTEGYLVLGRHSGMDEADGALYHYSPLLHALEKRTALPDAIAEELFRGLPEPTILVGLTSIHWRESWKYGERAYRYCQHDVGHALATISYAAAALGWRARLLAAVSDDDLSRLLGIAGQRGPEREHADCLLALSPGDGDSLVHAARHWRPSPSVLDHLDEAELSGSPNRLSAHHHDWPVIDQIAESCRKPATDPVGTGAGTTPEICLSRQLERPMSARGIFRSRRSAVAMDGTTGIDGGSFFRMLAATMPSSERPPLDSFLHPPAHHLVLFVHRVRGVEPGLHLLVRNPADEQELRSSFRREFRWESLEKGPRQLPLYRLQKGDFRRTAAAVSCHQEIASHGAFAVSMVSRFRSPLERHGPWLYRLLFWEAGAIGQVLYLEAEAAGIRGTGIGCYFDDETHRLLGLDDSATFQALYHFTVGGPLEDRRLRTAPPYGHLEGSPSSTDERFSVCGSPPTRQPRLESGGEWPSRARTDSAAR